jgi:hypothetical protein
VVTPDSLVTPDEGLLFETSKFSFQVVASLPVNNDFGH